MGKRTSLYSTHINSGAKMVDFGGWDMPLHYGSQIREHRVVREHAGLFDVSHMTVIDISGDESSAFLRYLLANDIAALEEPGAALYTLMLNHQGGVKDDLIVYAMGLGTYRLVANCTCRAKDLAWIKTVAQGFRVTISERSELAILAVQGPRARVLVSKALRESNLLRQKPATGLRETLSSMDSLQAFLSLEIPAEQVRSRSGPWLIARTGYSGEDGLEIILPRDAATAVWNVLQAVGIEPVGLGARDTLRLEAGLNLYGQEMDEESSALEVNLSWTISWEQEGREFIGRQALQAQLREGPHSRLVGLLMTEKGVLRAGQTVKIDGSADTGVLTSGIFSPTLRCGIGMARISHNDFCRVRAGQAGIYVDIRDKRIPVELVNPPFVRHGKKVYSHYAENGGSLD